MMKLKDNKIFMMGIGGIGVSALALMCKSLGAQVSGCDKKESKPILKTLKDKGIRILPENEYDLKGVDYLVYSNAVPFQHEIIQAAIKAGISIFKRGEFLGKFINENKSIAVTGSHGKTTVTFLIGHILKECNRSPKIYGGGIGLKEESNYIHGDGDWLVAELDESDRTFVGAKPTITVITNMDYEHIDLYKTKKEHTKAFEEFISGMKADSVLIINGDDEELLSISKNNFKGNSLITCGQGAHNRAKINVIMNGGTKVEFNHNGRKITLTSGLKGIHNAYNQTFAYFAGISVGLKPEELIDSISHFKGVRRRYEILRVLQNNTEIISDYGHHPTEIKAVLDTVVKDGKNKIIAVFEPHKNSRLGYFMNDFASVLQTADKVICTDIYTAGEGGDVGALMKELIEKIGNKAIYVSKNDIMNFVIDNYCKGEKVILFSAGDLDSIFRVQ